MSMDAKTNEFCKWICNGRLESSVVLIAIEKLLHYHLVPLLPISTLSCEVNQKKVATVACIYAPQHHVGRLSEVKQ